MKQSLMRLGSMTLFLSPTLTIILYKSNPDIKSGKAALVWIATLAIKTEVYEKMQNIMMSILFIH